MLLMVPDSFHLHSGAVLLPLPQLTLFCVCVVGLKIILFRTELLGKNGMSGNSCKWLCISVKRRTLLMKEENPYVWSVFGMGKSFFYIGRNEVNLNVLNLELDIKSLYEKSF